MLSTYLVFDAETDQELHSKVISFDDPSQVQ